MLDERARHESSLAISLGALPVVDTFPTALSPSVPQKSRGVTLRNEIARRVRPRRGLLVLRRLPIRHT